MFLYRRTLNSYTDPVLLCHGFILSSLLLSSLIFFFFSSTKNLDIGIIMAKFSFIFVFVF